MAREEDEDLYDEEFDFVDEEDDESDIEDSELTDERAPAERGAETDDVDAREDEAGDDQEEVDEYGRPEPAANYVVHIYEQQKFKRTIDRPFTPEDAEAFATEYNRTAKSYHRVAVTGKNDVKPKKALD